MRIMFSDRASTSKANAKNDVYERDLRRQIEDLLFGLSRHHTRNASRKCYFCQYFLWNCSINKHLKAIKYPAVDFQRIGSPHFPDIDLIECFNAKSLFQYVNSTPDSGCSSSSETNNSIHENTKQDEADTDCNLRSGSEGAHWNAFNEEPNTDKVASISNRFVTLSKQNNCNEENKVDNNFDLEIDWEAVDWDLFDAEVHTKASNVVNISNSTVISKGKENNQNNERNKKYVSRLSVLEGFVINKPMPENINSPITNASDTAAISLRKDTSNIIVIDSDSEPEWDTDAIIKLINEKNKKTRHESVDEVNIESEDDPRTDNVATTIIDLTNTGGTNTKFPKQNKPSHLEDVNCDPMTKNPVGNLNNIWYAGYVIITDSDSD